MKFKKSILVVDDEKVLLESLKDELSEYFDVYTASNGKEGLDIISKNKIAVAITDIRMPVMDGFNFILEAKKISPKTRFIVMTAYGLDKVMEAAKQWGFNKYIEKPFEVSELLKTIFECLKTPEGFKGKDIIGLNLVDILQLIQFNAKTTLIEVESEFGEKGQIFVKEGEVIHAEVEGKEEGEEAFYTIILWEGGEFKFLPLPKNTKVTIETPLTGLLLEGMRRKDELHRKSQEILLDKIKKALAERSTEMEEGKETLETGGKDTEKIRKEEDKRNEILEEFCNEVLSLEEAEGVVIFNKEAEITHFHYIKKNKEELIRRFILKLLDIGNKISHQVLKNLKYIILETDTKIIYTTPIYPAKCVIGIIGNKDLNIGLIKYLLDDISNKIEKVC